MGTVTVFDQPYPLVTLEEAKVALGEDSDDRALLIDGMILAAQGEMDGPKGWLGMCVAVQGIEYVIDDFSDPICLPFGPVSGAVEIYYLDADGAEQVVDAANYRVLADGRIVLEPEAEWPTSLYEQEGAVRFRYYAGIDDDSDPRIAMLRTAILLHVRMTLDGVERAASRQAIESVVRPLWVPKC